MPGELTTRLLRRDARFLLPVAWLSSLRPPDGDALALLSLGLAPDRDARRRADLGVAFAAAHRAHDLVWGWSCRANFYSWRRRSLRRSRSFYLRSVERSHSA